MALIRRNQGRELSPLRDVMERFFDDRLSRSGFWDMPMTAGGSIPLDIYDEGDQVVVKASVPGIRPEDLHVEVQEDVLHIWGEMKSDKERQDENYYMQEHRYGRIERSEWLPHPVDTEKAKAEFENGILTLALPKDVEARRREIQVQVKK